MSTVNLLCSLPGSPGLREFAGHLAAALDLAQVQERESSNEPDGYYVMGWLDRAKVTIARSDDEDHNDQPMWVQITDELVNQDALQATVGQLVRDKLGGGGFRVAQMLNFGKHSEQRIPVL